MNDEKLRRGLLRKGGDQAPVLDRVLQPLGRFAFSRARTVLLLGLTILVVGVVGVRQIQINDNPVKWFKGGHPIRVADTVMNRLFGGTYMAYVVAEGNAPEAIKRPQVMAYLDRVQAHLEADPLVGKTSSVADIVKRINLVLHDNDTAYHTAPDSREAVGQFLFLFQSSGDPDDLDNFVEREAHRATIWIQMKGGDNQHMQAVEERLAGFMRANPPPAGVTLRWSGLTHVKKSLESDYPRPEDVV